MKVLDKLGNIVERLEAFLDKAEDIEDGLGFRATAAELRKQLELIAKLQGELQQEGTTNITLNPEYLELRSAILVALEPHPAAAESVSRAMLELENSKG